MRGPGLFDNYCSCPDFARNTLGACQHIESLLARAVVRQRSSRYKRERAWLSLHYCESLGVRLNLPDNRRRRSNASRKATSTTPDCCCKSTR